MSVSNLNNISSQGDFEVSKLVEQNEELCEQNKCFQEEVWGLQRDKLRLQCDMENLQKKYLALVQQLNFSHKQGNDKNNMVVPEIIDVSVSSVSVTPDVPDTDPSIQVAEEKIIEMLGATEKDDCSPVSSCSVNSKIESDIPRKCSKCALLDTREFSTMHMLNLSDMCNMDVENTYSNGNNRLPQIPIYIDELLLEIKRVIEDIESTVHNADITSAVSRLKRIKKYLEENFSRDIDKSKSYLKFTKLVESVIFCIKKFAAKQENFINCLQEKMDSLILGNQNLYSKIRMLKDLLQSYGFLKVTNSEKEIESKSILLPLDAPFSSKKSYEDFSCDIANDPLLKRIIVPLLPVLNSSFKMLDKLNESMIELQFGLDSSQELTNNLIKRVQDQEIHLKSVTKEIEEVQQLVSVLKKQHRKLQSAEGIVKYDLQEKRKLLTKLKQQLENTREDFNRIRIKNSEAEAEWQDLHNEFAQRHKQVSEESGFLDDKNLEEQEMLSSNSDNDCNFLTEESGFLDDKNLEEHEMLSSNSDNDCNFLTENTPEKVVLHKDLMETSQNVPSKRQRLKLLEEQCQNLFSNLLLSSQRRQEMDKRLENMCKIIGKHNDGISSSSIASDISVKKSFENSANDLIKVCPEGNIQDNFSNEVTSDAGSSNSECNLCNDDSSSYNFHCDSSKTDSCISHSSGASAAQTIANEEEITVTHSFSEDLNSVCKMEDSDDISSCESVKLTSNYLRSSQLQTLSHVQSILIKKKNLEESLKYLEIPGEIECSKEEVLPQSEEYTTKAFAPSEDQMNLLRKVQELERKILVLSADLDEMTQQHMLSKSENEHQVAALESQLNTQAFKYEKSLKEFSEQSKSLEYMKKRVTEQEQLILALEDTLTEICSDRENEKEQQWHELEEIQIALEVREQECIMLCEELQKSMSEVEQEQNKNELLLSQLKEMKAYNEKGKDTMEAEILFLKQYLKELQRKLVKLLKEKDILWKKNNYLYHMQKIKIDDRWMNDSEVSSCMGCKNDFSFMLRKHHCRLCGRIFCYVCSNNWLYTASSSKKIRACNECFMQHIQIKKDIRKGSNVPFVEDDSGEEANNDYFSSVPTSSSTLNSSAVCSIANSVTSLPFTKKLSTPRFASVPDLRGVIEQDEVISCYLSLVKENAKEKKEEITCTAKNSEIESDTPVTLDTDSRSFRLKEIFVDEIISEECGLSGKFIIRPLERCDLPIVCNNYPVVLKWSFISNYQNISLTITHEGNEFDMLPKILYKASNRMEDEMKLSLPGFFLLQFNNENRNSRMEVQYLLQIKSV